MSSNTRFNTLSAAVSEVLAETVALEVVIPLILDSEFANVIFIRLKLFRELVTLASSPHE